MLNFDLLLSFINFERIKNNFIYFSHFWGLWGEPFHGTHSRCFTKSIQPALSRGDFPASTHRIESWMKDFHLVTHEMGKIEMKRKFRNSKIRRNVDRISIYADIILKSFYCSTKVQLSKSLLCDVEREKGRNLCGATAMKGELIVVLCTQNKFNIIRFIIITSCQHKVYLS
jgi:hypothetical protein